MLSRMQHEGGAEADDRRRFVPTPANHFSGETQAERTAYWASAARDQAHGFEERSRTGLPWDAHWATRPWIDGHIVDWWKPDIEHLKRTEQYGLALDLAWRCMVAVEEATFAHNVQLDTHWAQEAAIVARKMRNYGLEVQICEQVLDIDYFPDHVRDYWEGRLAAAERLVGRSRP